MYSKCVKFLLVCLIGVTGCKTAKVSKQPTEPSTAAVLSDKEKLDFAYVYYDAMKDKILGNYPSSRQKFQQAVRINPRSAPAHYELSQLAIVEERFDQAEISAQTAVRFDNQNNWYKLSLAGIYERTGKLSKMITLLEELLKGEPANSEYQFALASAYVQADRYEDAITMFNRLEADYGISEDLAIQKKDLFMRMKKPDKAIAEIQKLIAAFPEEAGYHGFLAEIYEAMDKPQDALAEFEEILRLDPQNPNVNFSLADFYRDQGNKEKSYESLKNAFKNPTADFKLKAHVLASYFGITDRYPELKSQAIELCEVLIEAHPEEPQAHAIYGDFLLRDAKFDQARAEYEKVLQSDKSVFSVWSQLLFITAEQNDYAHMLALSKEAMELFPNQPSVFLYHGLASMQLKDYQTAIEALNQGIAITADNNQLLSQFYASLGDAYHFVSNYPKSNSSYEEALKLDSKNTYVLNNYAYYLSLRKENLERAKELALKCNELSPGNPSYQDTYAWVLYQAGNYDEANSWLDKALANGGMKNPTLMEHKGDILWKLGKTSDALDYWNRAKELGATGKIDQKISQQKLIE